MLYGNTLPEDVASAYSLPLNFVAQVKERDMPAWKTQGSMCFHACIARSSSCLQACQDKPQMLQVRSARASPVLSGPVQWALRPLIDSGQCMTTGPCDHDCEIIRGRGRGAGGIESITRLRTSWDPSEWKMPASRSSVTPITCRDGAISCSARHAGLAQVFRSPMSAIASVELASPSPCTKQAGLCSQSEQSCRRVSTRRDTHACLCATRLLCQSLDEQDSLLECERIARRCLRVRNIIILPRVPVFIPRLVDAGRVIKDELTLG